MALDLGDLVGKITLEDEYTPTLDQADRKTGGFGKTFGKVALGVGVAAGAMGVAVAVGVGALVKAGVEYNAEMDTYRTNLTTMLGSADKAKSMMADLSSFAAATPFEMPQLADASQTMLSFGETAQNLMPDLKMLGDISLGNSDKLSGLALVFGQVQSTGHLMGQDVLQMINQGFNPLKAISDKTGESMASLKQRMADGKVSFQEVKDAMIAATGPGGQFFNAMANGAMTFSGQTSTLTDGLHILEGSITGALTDSLTQGALPALNETVNALLGLVNGTEGADDALQTAADHLVTAISTGIGPAIEGLVAQLGKVLTALGPALGKIAVTLVQSLAAVLPGLVVVASQIILSLVSAIVQAAPAMVQAAIPAIVNLVTGLLAMLPMLIQAGLQILLALEQGLVAAIPVLIPAAVSAVLGMVQALVSQLPVFMDVALKFLVALATGIIQAIPQLVAALPAIILGIVDYLVSAIPMLIDAGIKLLISLVTALPTIIQAIVKAIPKIITGIIDALINTIPQLIDAGVQLFIALIENLPLIIVTLIGAIPQIVGGIVKAFTDPKTLAKMAQAGMALIQGLWDGIKKIWDQLTKWFSDVAGDLIDGFKDIFGIHSPSTVFADIGMNIGQGMINGLKQIQPEVDASFAAMATVPPSPGAQLAAAGSSVVNNTRTVVVNMESNQAQMTEETIYQALGSARAA